jgi:glutathione S-transferase
MLLYVDPTIYPAARRVLIYVAEKQIPSSVVITVPPPNDLASKEYPPPKGTTVPVLAIRKTADGARSDPQSYQYLGQSCAIMEYLEDLCDQNPDISPVPSLRGGEDYIKRLLIRGLMAYGDEGFQNISYACL